MDPILVEVLRGDSVESTHLVDAVVADEHGARVAAFGDFNKVVYPRSAIKPLQALPFVLSGACDRLENPNRVISLACSSHDAERRHLETLSSWHKGFDLSESDLVCGPHPPEDRDSYFELIREGRVPCRLHNNCSGKHTAMLSACRANSWPTLGYELYDHPVQREIRQHLSGFSGLDHESLPWGIDGCGIPTYALPLEVLAKMMAVFLPGRSSDRVGEALQRIRRACAEEPWMIGGKNSLSSQIGALTGGKVLAKIGAEGNYCAVIFDRGLSIALNARDGAERASEAALFALLERYGGIDRICLQEIKQWAAPPLKNWAGTVVGSLRVSLAN